MNLAAEITTWSTAILKQIADEEDCSLHVRETCIRELERRTPGCVAAPPVTLTPEMIHSVKTAAGGWTMAQIKALGVQWPPRGGWIKRLSGQTISQRQWQAFVDGVQEFRPSTEKRRAKFANHVAPCRSMSKPCRGTCELGSQPPVN